MLRKFKPSEFACAMGVSCARVSVAIKRNQLIKENKTIDLDNPVNKIWMQDKEEKGFVFDINKLYDKVGPVKNLQKTETPTPQPKSKKQEKQEYDKTNLALEKQRLDVEILRKRNRLDQLKIEKQEGLLVPSDAARDVFIWCIETFYNTFSEGVKNLATIYAVDHNHFVEIQKNLNESLVDLKEDAKKGLLSGIDGVIAEYQEVRGRGESK